MLIISKTASLSQLPTKGTGTSIATFFLGKNYSMGDQREVHEIIPPLPLAMCAWRFEWRSVWQALVSVSTCVLYDDINTRANHTHNVHIFIHTRLIDGRFSPGDGEMGRGGGTGMGIRKWVVGCWVLNYLLGRGNICHV